MLNIVDLNFFRASKTVFNGFWHGPELGPMRMACLASFVRMGHQFELYTYEPVTVPKGVTIRDANTIIPLSEIFYYENQFTGRRDIGPFSDLFRFKLLMEKGGWWSDVDAFCLSKSIPTVERAWAQEKPELSPDAVGTSQIAFAANDSVVRELYESCLNLSKAGFSTREALGPLLISDVIRKNSLPTNCFGSPATFYPVRWIEMFKLWLPQFKNELNARLRKAIFLPTYASFPQYIGLDLGKYPPKGSYLADLCDKYIGGCLDLERYSAQEVLEGTRDFFSRNADWAPSELREVAGPESLLELGIHNLSARGSTRSNVTIGDNNKLGKISEKTLVRISGGDVEINKRDILCVVGVKNEYNRIPYFIEYYKKIGVNKFLIMDNCSNDGTFEYIMRRDDCILFRTNGSHFEMNTQPPRWTNAILNTYAENHWCVVVDADELLVYPHSEAVPLDRLIAYLDSAGFDGMMANMIDQYADGALAKTAYTRGQAFGQACAYFDSEPGWLRAYSGSVPPVQMFGGVRERAFWHGRFRSLLPPCLTKVPLVKWRHGERYLAAQHTISKAKLAPIVGGLLHYKFLVGFADKNLEEINNNEELIEKGLQEREAYAEAMRNNPNLTLMSRCSVKYRNSEQLVEYGWCKTEDKYEEYCRGLGGEILQLA
ncbi:glycosyltransferase family 2 protein [Mesorhizobium marinum]|uniref:glycosyltransferase family 2 protein n=1 Tax=Mesorhizobium marinum TaxID=3228790 RepID=UPI003465C850